MRAARAKFHIAAHVGIMRSGRGARYPGKLDSHTSRETSCTPSSRAFYENYWAGEQAPPDEDPLTEARVRHFLKVASGTQAVLDLGCGSGRRTRLLTGSAKRVVGFDVSHEALRRARERDGAAAYLQGACDAALPFPRNSFDAVYCAEVIEHLLDPETMVRECHRVLKRSGIFFVTTPYHGLIKNLVIAAAAFDRHFNPTGPHIRFFTSRSLRGLLTRNGFDIQRVSYLGRFWPFWMNMVVYARKR